MVFKYTCSLGVWCHSSQMLKDNSAKRCSYPFDWVHSSCDTILHCIEDDFKIFLDKSYYKSESNSKCAHLLYHPEMFNHHNPLSNEDNYNYYIRCVDRFRQLLKTEESKFFIMMLPNNNNITEDMKEEVIRFNEQFSKHTTNYKLLVILHVKDRSANYHHFTHSDNIDFLELHTIASSGGTYFLTHGDNHYFNDIIRKTYEFDLEN